MQLIQNQGLPMPLVVETAAELELRANRLASASAFTRLAQIINMTNLSFKINFAARG